MNVLITGSTGFIGRHVLDLLLERGETVVSFGRRNPDVAPDYAARHTHVSGDLSTGQGLEKIAWAEIDRVIHLAAAGVKAAQRAWTESLAVNVVGTQRLLDALYGATRFPRLFIARTFYEKLAEERPSFQENPYVATKVAATQLVRIFAVRYAGQVVFGNFFQVYGPGDDRGNVLTYAAQEFISGRSPVIGSGKGLRDWIFVTDAARAVLACIDAPQRSAEFDIGSGELRSIKEMVERLHSLCKAAPRAVFDSSKDRADLDVMVYAQSYPPCWKPVLSPNEGLIRLLS